MRRFVVLIGALVVPVLPAVVAAPAYAATNTICVGTADPACGGAPLSTISAALTAANVDGQDSVVLVGPGTFTEGPLTITGDSSPLLIKGAGQGVTELEPPAAAGQQTYLSVNHATVSDLTLTMPAATSDGDQAIQAYNGSVIDHVTVDGSGTTNTTGVHLTQATLSHSVVQLPKPGGTRAVYVEGASLVSDSAVTGTTGVSQSATPGSPDTLTRLTISAGFDGIVTDGGIIDVDDTVVDLGSSSGSGILVANFNNSPTPKVVNANHLTIVGGGAGSEGVYAYAASPAGKQSAIVTLTNSIVRGPTVSVLAEAGNDGAQGGNSVATVTMSHTDYQVATPTSTANGTATITLQAGNVVDVDPAFVNPAAGDYHLPRTSPLVDQGDPAAGGPALDRDGLARVVDGDGNGSQVRDMGAYEYQDVTAPDTVISSGPQGPTSDATPTFGFTSETGATFECKVDSAAYAACASPFTTAPLADGAHAFSVRATDASHNTDATPATRPFTVDTVAPETVITKKPAKRVTTRKVKVAFSAEAGATFQCQVDGTAWKPCSSPLKVRLKLGRHTILVRASDALGNVDATPAKVKVRRVARPA